MSEKDQTLLEQLAETAKQLPPHGKDLLTAYAQGMADGIQQAASTAAPATQLTSCPSMTGAAQKCRRSSFSCGTMKKTGRWRMWRRSA